MTRSIYHILYKVPAIYQEDMQYEYETLAQKLLHSGRLRVDTGYCRNFVRFSDQDNDLNAIFSDQEIKNPDLIPLSQQIIKDLYKKRNITISKSKTDSIINSLRNNQLKKIIPVSDEIKIQLARVFVQSAHPIVIRWMLLDRVEVYIAYSQNIGDVMDVENWKTSGDNSGMQSTDSINVCIYVSCGGDPFEQNNKKHPTIGDGWAAVARMQIVAGQEIGHYADIKRDSYGRQITRHSANLSCTRPTLNVKTARLNDIERCNSIYRSLLDNGMKKLIVLEKQLKIHDTFDLFNVWKIYIKLKVYYFKYKLCDFAYNNNMMFVLSFQREKYMSLMIVAMIEDMKTHLTPKADVYKNSNPEVEEAIACAEALARVPQQVMKWGHLITKAIMGDLYKVYYKEVIPSLIESYNNLTGFQYKRNFAMPKTNILQKIINRLFKRKRFKFEESRELPS